MSRPRVILIVEDNPGDVRLMREALRELKTAIDIQVAADGDEARQYLGREGQYTSAPRPDLIFLDFNLPKSNSRELLRYIKADPDLSVVPVAVLTTSDADKDVRDAYDLKANCYLRKPVDLDGFLHTIRAAAHFWLDIAYMPSPRTGECPNTPRLV